MLGAAAGVVAELGYGGMSVARVTGRAGVSRRTFYELFEDREDCFLAAFEDAVARAGSVAGAAYQAASGGWREQVRAGLTALLWFLDEEPGLGSLMIVEALSAGPRVIERRAQVLRTLEQSVDRGRSEAGGVRESLPSLTAEGIVGAVFSVIHARILEKGHPRLLGLVNQLMGVIVLPYLGAAAAEKELRRRAPKTPRSQPRPTKEPLQGLDMRFTYRTLRVVAAIAAEPSASNRRIAEHAGVHDQGQISKLLTRLKHLGLIQNTGQGHAKGKANAWRLTATGQKVQNAIYSGSE